MSPLDKTVLVVEDSDLNRKLLHDVLEAHSVEPIWLDGRDFGATV